MTSELETFLRVLRRNRQSPMDQDLNATAHMLNQLATLYPDVVRRYGVTVPLLAEVLRTIRTVEMAVITDAPIHDEAPALSKGLAQ